MITKLLAAVTIAGGLFGASSGTAFATHDHFVMREDRNGDTTCRYIAEGQTSKEHPTAADPDAGEPGGGKFHDNVHLGEPSGEQPNGRENGTDFDKSENEARCETVEESGQP